MSAAETPECEAISHTCGSSTGVLVLHGFTGNPSSVRGVATAMIEAGLDVELPRLPGHGTSIDDMLTTDWADWSSTVEAAYAMLAARCDEVVVAGLSMGATLALSCALRHGEIAGVVCINPATRVRDDDVLAMVDEFIDDGITIVPGTGSDIADPDAFDISYDGTPLRPLRSLMLDGIGPITDRFGELQMPLRLFTSRNDHVVDPSDSEYLAAEYGGPVEHTWLERSYHVATRDFDRDVVETEAVAFVRRLGLRWAS